VSFDVGTLVSHYRLERRLGAGGMGEVYLARDLQLDRQVAIKFLVAPADDQSRRRLLREARAVAALDHPYICAVFDVGTDPAHGDFIVMSYVEGESLAARLRRGRLRTDEALAIGGHIAEALIAAHRHGIVHRDLKPQNVIITPAGDPKLLDFGLATYVAATRAAAEAETVSPLTQPQAVIGTPGYMAPEQVRNQPADFRSDVFALGCVLYECLTGRRAFFGATTADVFGQVLHVDPPPVSSLSSDLGPAHDALCARLLHKAPDQRFQSAEEVLGAIRALTPRTTSGAVPASTSRDTLTSHTWRVLRARPRTAAITLGACVGAGLFGLWLWSRWRELPVPPVEARGWYDRGVEALREGTYAGARASFEEAVRLFPQYVQAYSRLAEACSELDDERCAQAALVRVGALVPNQTWLNPEERLRLDAARASVLRDHDQAIADHRALVDRQPRDAGRWLDLGRAEEAAGRRAAARQEYAKAIELDRQYAAGHLRLGVLQAQAGLTAPGLASLDEAIRLYRTAANVEGEAEALLRKGIALSTLGQFGPARDALERVVQLAADPRYVSQRVRAHFELVRVTFFGGQFTEAEAIAREAVAEATGAGLQSLAAIGFIDLGNALLAARRYEDADAPFGKAIDIAKGQGAKRTEMRAQLQRAALRLESGKPEDAIALAAEPLRFFSESRDSRLEATAKTVVARADTSLERYEDASRLTAEVLRFAEASHDDVLVAQSLENLASQLARLGRLPEALAYRERIDRIHRGLKDHLSLAYDLVNHAELLILLGRGRDAEPLLGEVEQAIAAGDQAYAGRRQRAALLRALQASTERRFAEVGAFAATARGTATVKPDGTPLFAIVLAEYALAALGQSRIAPAVIAQWPHDATAPVLQRELSFWAAATLIERHQNVLAYAVASEAWSLPGAQGNLELRWRLAAVAAEASRGIAVPPDGANMPGRATSDAGQLTTTWAGDAAAYFARPDLAVLRRNVS
jgi:serine/threonine protein kinase